MRQLEGTLGGLILVILLTQGLNAFAQTEYTVQGYVYDALTQEVLPGSAIAIAGTSQGTTTDINGYFAWQLPAETHKLIISFLGYTPQNHTLILKQDTTLRIGLVPTAIMTDEVVIESESSDELRMQTIERVSLKQQEIEQLPYLFGEVDPVKAIQWLPGVQTSGEGNTGFYVRGGGLDQNLILLDKAPVYNPSHLFGFFSVFNGSVLDNAELIRGGIPANYGGRLSSVLNTTTREGDKQKLKGRGGLGMIAANLQVEVPIVKGKSSVMVAGRRTYYDALSRTFFPQGSPLRSGLDYFFHDVNLKADYRFSDRDYLSVQGYWGDDRFWYSNFGAFANQISWGNRVASATWQHSFSPKWLAETSLYYSRYYMDFAAKVSDYRLRLSSGVQDLGGQYELMYTPSERHTITMGAQYVRHRFLPNNIQATTLDTELDFGEAATLHTREIAVFGHDNWEINERWKASAGVRASYFQHLGPFERYLSSQLGVVQDTATYQAGERIAQYTQWEPRVALSYEVHRGASLKAAWDRMAQYSHMAPMSSTSLPTDVWLPSSANIAPQTSTQFSLSYHRQLAKKNYKGSVTLYYKTMENQMEYRDGVLIGYDRSLNFDDNFLFGLGRSYGAEFFVRKKQGALRGWLSYTLSRTTRQFDEINQGAVFSARFDRLHDLSLLANYRYSPRWQFSGVFVFSTGNTMTLPVARYVMQGNIVNEYAGRNNYRLAPYHRLDLSVTYLPTQIGRFQSRWVFSVYNTYSRLNPYFIYFDVQGSIREYELSVQARQISLFPVIPSITYQFSF